MIVYISKNITASQNIKMTFNITSIFQVLTNVT